MVQGNDSYIGHQSIECGLSNSTITMTLSSKSTQGYVA